MKNTVYFFTGENQASKKIAIDKIKTELSIQSNSMDYDIFYGNDLDSEQFFTILYTPPFTSSKRLVILKNADELKADLTDKLIDYIKKPSQKTILIISQDPVFAQTDKLYKQAKQFVKHINFFSDEYIGISDKEVFKLVDYIGNKQCRGATNTLFNLMNSGKTHMEIIGVIGWYIRRLKAVKILIDKGVKATDIAGMLKINVRTLENTINHARNFTLEEIVKSQILLADTDVNIKKSISKPETLLEMLIVRLSMSI